MNIPWHLIIHAATHVAGHVNDERRREAERPKGCARCRGSEDVYITCCKIWLCRSCLIDFNKAGGMTKCPVCGARAI
jgi:hypothetical protein